MVAADGLFVSLGYATQGTSAVPGRNLPGSLLSFALRAICDMENLAGVLDPPLVPQIAWWCLQARN